MLQHLGKVTDTMITMTKTKFKIRETQDTLVARLGVEENALRHLPQSVNHALSKLLKQAADRIEELETYVGEMDDIIMRLERKLNERENFGQHD